MGKTKKRLFNLDEILRDLGVYETTEDAREDVLRVLAFAEGTDGFFGASVLERALDLTEKQAQTICAFALMKGLLARLYVPRVDGQLKWDESREIVTSLLERYEDKEVCVFFTSHEEAL